MTWSYMRLGLEAARAHKAAEAAVWFRRSLDDLPDDPVARAWLGQSLCKTGRRAAGVAELRAAARRLLEEPAASARDKAYEVIAQLQRWGDVEGAADLSRQAVRVAASDPRAHELLALACSQLNLQSEALAACRRALAMRSADKSQGDRMLDVLRASLEADAGERETARRRLEAVLADAPEPRVAFRAHKELARVLDGLEAWDQVFDHLDAAAAKAPELPEYRAQDPRLIPSMVEANFIGFDDSLLCRWGPEDFAGEPPAPAFVMGFYRSGTTLTEQVLATRPEVFVASESSLISEVQRQLERGVPGGTIAEKLRSLDLAGVKKLRRAYWRLVVDRYGPRALGKRFIDKTTLNTIDIGLINAIFPDARVIFMVREPRDTCLSCVLQLMPPTPATVHLLTLRGAASMYALVMDWWLSVRRRLTLSVLEVRYEDAVTSFETTYRDVFRFLDLPWSPEAREFHRGAVGRFIASPSHGQVARPLYRTSIARWRRYCSRFEALGDQLEPIIEDLGYDM